MKRTTLIIAVSMVVCLLALGAIYAAAQQPETVSGGGGKPGHVEDMVGTVVDTEAGTDGMNATVESAGELFSVTISGIHVELFGRWDDIVEGARVQVSGELIDGMEPTWVVADRVIVHGSEPDEVLNLRGTVTEIEPGTDGVTAMLAGSDGTTYSATISGVCTEIVYIGDEETIEVGTRLWLSGELVDLDGPHVVADRVVVDPIE